MLGEIDPKAQPAFGLFLGLLDEKLGDRLYMVYEGRRRKEVQEAYYAQGRKGLDEVNALRKAAGLYLLRYPADNYTITWTLESKHIAGLAMDVVPVDGAGNPTWDLAHFWPAFEKIRDCGREAGLICGADWPAPRADWPHYEFAG
jgi:peptidoglycan L-alanyl-D-glutamate endopeptidase CwlK